VICPFPGLESLIEGHVQLGSDPKTFLDATASSRHLDVLQEAGAQQDNILVRSRKVKLTPCLQRCPPESIAGHDLSVRRHKLLPRMPNLSRAHIEAVSKPANGVKWSIRPALAMSKDTNTKAQL